jgi:hypothetical protein
VTLLGTVLIVFPYGDQRTSRLVFLSALSSLLESKKTLQVHVAIDNAIRQIPQRHSSFYIVMQQLFHRSLQTSTASQQQWWEEKWDK